MRCFEKFLKGKICSFGQKIDWLKYSRIFLVYIKFSEVKYYRLNNSKNKIILCELQIVNSPIVFTFGH